MRASTPGAEGKVADLPGEFRGQPPALEAIRSLPEPARDLAVPPPVDVPCAVYRNRLTSIRSIAASRTGADGPLKSKGRGTDLRAR